MIIAFIVLQFIIQQWFSLIPEYRQQQGGKRNGYHGRRVCMSALLTMQESECPPWCPSALISDTLCSLTPLQICAIIGGTFTVAGILDSCIFTASEAWKKIQLGKIH